MSQYENSADQQMEEGVGQVEIIGHLEIRTGAVDKSQTTDATDENETPISPCQTELKHLQKRVENVRESMQLSNSITNSKTYQENVLNASANCVNEWRQIISRYSGGKDALSEGEIKEASLDVFQLIQLSLQCGPLAGSKPGYFKRCGSQVAKVVVEYISIIAPNVETSCALGFTENQVKALDTWKSNAQKAVANDNPPSKSQLKKYSKQGKKQSKG